MASTVAVRAPVKAAEFDWRLAHGDPIVSPRHVRLMQMAEAVRQETNGRLDIKIFPAYTLGTQSGQLTQLRENVIQMLMTLDANYANLVPVASIESLGFVFSSQKQACQVMDGALGAYVTSQYVPKGLHCFEWAMDQGFRQVSSSTHPIRNVDDFAGFKLRTAPSKIYVDFFRSLGASPVPMDAAELYTSLQTHLLDGQETPLEYVESAKIYEVQKYISLTNHIWAANWLTANLDAWNSLPPDVQVVLTRNVKKAILQAREDTYAMNSTLVAKLTEQGITFNTPDLSKAHPRLKAYYAEWKDQLGSTAWNLLEASVGKLT